MAPKQSDAIRLAEASDWTGLQQLIEKAPEYACVYGDYGMLPIHWACTEAHVPLTLLQSLLHAYPDGAKTKNDANLLPLHIAIRARVETAWIQTLVAQYADAVHVVTPNGSTAVQLAMQVGLQKEAIAILEHASTMPSNQVEEQEVDAPIGDEVEETDWQRHLHSHPDEFKHARHRSGTTVTQVSTAAGDESHNNTNTNQSNRSSFISSSSSSSSASSISSCVVSPRASTPPLVSPSSASTDSPKPSTTKSTKLPAPLHKQMRGPFHRKHSLDYHAAQAAAAAAAAADAQRRQYYHGNQTLPPNVRSMSMLGGRHQSLPVIPSFEHIQLHLANANGNNQVEDDLSSSDDDDEAYHRHHNHHHITTSARLYFPSNHLPKPSTTNHRSTFQVDTSSRSSRSFESPPEWKRDDECSICRASFGMFKHRHHCRNCGKSICSQHSADKKILMASKGFTTPQRVCVTCYAMITHKEAKTQQRKQSLQITPSTTSNGESAVAVGGRLSPYANSTPSSNTTITSSGTTTAPVSDARTISKDKMEAMVLHAQLTELRHVLTSQQKQIEQLTQTHMVMQQQLLEQEELKAETMLLITQLMTRVSVLELQKQEKDEEDEEHPA